MKWIEGPPLGPQTQTTKPPSSSKKHFTHFTFDSRQELSLHFFIFEISIQFKLELIHFYSSYPKLKDELEMSPSRPMPEAELKFQRCPTEFKGMFERGWTYPIRPLNTGKKYPYRLLNSSKNIASFFVILTDPIGQSQEQAVAKGLTGFKDLVDNYGISPFHPSALREMIPVVARNKGKYYRGEVNMIDEFEKRVNVNLVDIGREEWVDLKDIFQPSIALMRYSKLALHCGIAQLVPAEGAQNWAEMNYKSLLSGATSSLITPIEVIKGTLVCFLTLDGIDAGLKAMMLGVADLTPLTFDPHPMESFGPNPYPKYDYINWFGTTFPVFTIRSLNPPEAIIQLDVPSANNISNQILTYLAATPDAETQKFEKEVGCPVLARHSEQGEFFRGTIFQKLKMNLDFIEQQDHYVVKYVDYWDFSIIPESWMIKIPDDLCSIPECGAKVLLVELADAKLNEKQKRQLTKLLKDKDFICNVGAVDQEWNGQHCDLCVSLSMPANEADLIGESLAKIMGLPEIELEENFDYNGPYLSKEVAQCLFSKESRFYPQTTYKGVLSCSDSDKSIYLQLEGDAEKADLLSNEMTEFYSNWGDELTLNQISVEMYVAVKQDSDKRWYRAKIRSINSTLNIIEIMFIDYGNVEIVHLNSLKPLIPFFGSHPLLALQTATPIEPIQDLDMFLLSDRVLEFCEDGNAELKVILENSDGYNYAWIWNGDQELGKNLVEFGLGTHLLFQE